MRALSLWQPWAHAVVHLGKRIENRQWRGCSYRGPFLIHAAKGFGKRDDFDDAVAAILDVVDAEHHLAFRKIIDGDGQRWKPGGLPLGGVVGAAVVEGVIDGPQRPPRDDQKKWWTGGFALVLRDVIPVPFRQWKGEQGWFDVPWARPVMSGDGSRLLGVDWSEP